MVTWAGGPKVYVATAEAHDAEMAEKIAAHKKIRGDGWETREAPRSLVDALRPAPTGGIILVDCATLWLSNLLLAEADLACECDRLVDALAVSPCPIVVVTNETGQGIVPENALARRFRSAQGRLNQRLAAEAGLVVAVLAGLPMVLKGRLPEAFA